MNLIPYAHARSSMLLRLASAVLIAALALLVVASTPTSVDASGPSTLGRTGWEVARPYSPVDTPTFGQHGHVGFYDYIPGPVPGATHAAWSPCGPGNSVCPNVDIIGMAIPSILPSTACLSSADFTFFQSFVSIPAGTTISQFSVNMSGADDGARVAIYNSANPTGSVFPGSYIYLNGAQSTTDLSTAMVAGEVNRVVITQVDDCATGNNLNHAEILLNGTVVPPAPPPTQTLSILGGVGAPGSVDASTDWSDDVVAWDAGITTTGAWHFTGDPNPVWEAAYLVGGHPWGLVPDTTSWINCGPTNASAECGNASGTVVAFRVRFTIPAGSINPDITFWINSDNAGTYYINGTQVTDRLVGGPGRGANPVPPSAPGTPGVLSAALQSALQTGDNEMLVVVEDWGGLAGFNFRADLTVEGTEPPVIVPPTPADTTPPEVTVDVAGTLGDNGWYTSDVAVTWTVTDAESTITGTTGCDDVTVTEDTASVTFTCTATSAGGTTSESVTLKRDATAPTATATRAPVANVHGWNDTPVTVSFSGTDAMSGVASCDGDVVLGEGAGQSASGTCTDNAGNVSDPAAVTDVNVDLTAPTVAVTGVTDGATYIVGDVPDAGCSTTDALSGVATAATATTTGGPVGSITVDCTGAEDLAGNGGSASATYSVVYDFCGFEQPLLAPVQTFKIKSTIPVKFCVQDAFGEPVTDLQPEVYANGVLMGTARYDDDRDDDDDDEDGNDGHYVFNLRTRGMDAGPLIIEIRLGDGSTHSIEVTLGKKGGHGDDDDDDDDEEDDDEDRRRGRRGR